MSLVVEEADTLAEAVLPQGGGDLVAGMAGADDNDGGQVGLQVAGAIHPANFIHWRRVGSRAVWLRAPQDLDRQAPSMRDR